MANVNTKAHVLVREGFKCHYCGRKLYGGSAIKLLDVHEPGLELWDLHGKKPPLRHSWATVDHLKPESEGGMDVLENLVACCVECNSRKGDSEYDSPSPEQRREDWDGLAGVFLALADRYPDHLSTEDRKWVAALKREGIVAAPESVEPAVQALKQLKAEEGEQ